MIEPLPPTTPAVGLIEPGAIGLEYCQRLNMEDVNIVVFMPPAQERTSSEERELAAYGEQLRKKNERRKLERAARFKGRVTR